MSHKNIRFHGEPPEIVCLCGSTKFKDEFREANKRLTIEGKIVLSVGFFGHVDGWPDEATHENKNSLDELHKRKIDLADRVLVINVDGYIGDSTRSEIEYAYSHGVPVDYLEDDGYVNCPNCEMNNHRGGLEQTGTCWYCGEEIDP